MEQKTSGAVYLHGGYFSVPSMLGQLSLKDPHPCRANSLWKNVVGIKGTVLLRRKSEEDNETDRFSLCDAAGVSSLIQMGQHMWVNTQLSTENLRRDLFVHSSLT